MHEHAGACINAVSVTCELVLEGACINAASVTREKATADMKGHEEIVSTFLLNSGMRPGLYSVHLYGWIHSAQSFRQREQEKDGCANNKGRNKILAYCQNQNSVLKRT